MDEGNPLDRNIAIIFMVVGTVVLWKRKINWSSIVQNNGWMIWLYYYCCISVLWSDLPMISFKRWIRDLGNVIMVLIILTDIDPAEAFRTIIRRCMYVLMPLSIVFIKWYPEFGRYWGPFGGDPLYVGVSVGKNGLGQICMIGGFFFVWDSLVRLKKKTSQDRYFLLINILYILMIVYLFIKANSQTSLMTFIIGLVMLFGLSLLKTEIKYINILLIHIAMLIIAIQMTEALNTLFINIGRDPTMSGRTELWEHLIQMNANPFIGTGYRSFWAGERLSTLWRDYWWHPKQAHSGYLETFLNLGILGLFSLMTFIFASYRIAKKELIAGIEIGKFRMVVLFMLLIYNYTEASFIISTPLWFLFLLTTIKIPQPMVLSNS
jgi:O-antigen ligase